MYRTFNKNTILTSEKTNEINTIAHVGLKPSTFTMFLPTELISYAFQCFK